MASLVLYLAAVCAVLRSLCFVGFTPVPRSYCLTISCILRSAKQGDASLPLQPPLPQIAVECQSSGERWKEAPQPFSLHQSRQLLFQITRSHFYSHTPQPMSSHLRSPACKLHRSVSPNDADRQWCVFSSSWHSKYKWGIIYNGFKPKANAFAIERDPFQDEMELRQTLMCFLPVDIASGVNGKQIKQLAKSLTVIHGVKQQLFLNCTI